MADSGMTATEHDGKFLVSVMTAEEDFLYPGDWLLIDPHNSGIPGDWVLTFDMTIEQFASQKGRRGRVCGLQRAI